MDLIHTCLNVTDAERAVEFYAGELGFEETWSFEMEFDGRRVVNRYVAADNGVELQLKHTEGTDDLEVGDAWDHVAVTVEDVDAAVEEIDHYGLVRGPLEVEAAGARVAFVEDPDGHVVELVQPLE